MVITPNAVQVPPNNTQRVQVCATCRCDPANLAYGECCTLEHDIGAHPERKCKHPAGHPENFVCPSSYYPSWWYCQRGNSSGGDWIGCGECVNKVEPRENKNHEPGRSACMSYNAGPNSIKPKAPPLIDPEKDPSRGNCLLAIQCSIGWETGKDWAHPPADFPEGH
jgi:hypothetical protein